MEFLTALISKNEQGSTVCKGSNLQVLKGFLSPHFYNNMEVLHWRL